MADGDGDDGGEGATAERDGTGKAIDPGRGDGDVHRPADDPADREFGARGWLLVAGIAVAFFVVPGLIYASRSIGLPFTVAYLALPLVPAVLLAVLAVWATAGS